MTDTRFLKAGEHTLAALAFNEQAEGLPIVFIHGITSTNRLWLNQTPYVAENRRWYALSLPGHYPASMPAGFHADALTAELITDLLCSGVRQLVGDSPVVLVGHSTGGFGVLGIAAKMPQQVSAVLSISGFAQGRWTGILGLAQMLAQTPIGPVSFRANVALLGAWRGLFRAGMGSYVYDRQAFYSYPNLDAVIDVLYEDYSRTKADHVFPYFRRMPYIDISDWLPAIQAPTLVLHGDRDPIVPPAQADLIAARVPHSQQVWFKGCGHIPMGERADQYTETVTTFLQAHV